MIIYYIILEYYILEFKNQIQIKILYKIIKNIQIIIIINIIYI